MLAFIQSISMIIITQSTTTLAPLRTEQEQQAATTAALRRIHPNHGISNRTSPFKRGTILAIDAGTKYQTSWHPAQPHQQKKRQQTHAIPLHCPLNNSRPPPLVLLLHNQCPIRLQSMLTEPVGICHPPRNRLSRLRQLSRWHRGSIPIMQWRTCL